MLLGATFTALALGLVVALHDAGPSIFGDELIYARNAQAIAALRADTDPHFPPFYSALLALGTLLPDGYRGMLLINAVVSALTVPAMELLARSIRLRRPWVPVAVSALLPFHGVYAGYLMSENVSVPLFILGVALALRGRRSDAAYLGLALGALHLTKYLFAPAVILLLGVWLARLARPDGLRRRDDGAARRVLGPAAVALACYLSTIAAWVAYGTASGNPLGSLSGLSVVSKTAGGAISRGPGSDVLLWAGSYLGYLVLASLVAWTVIALWAARPRHGRRTLEPVQSAFVATTALLIVGYTALGTQHSFGAPYNYPEPSHMQGRYLIHLVPIIVALGALALDELEASGSRPRGARLWLPVGALVALAWLAWWILFRGGLWGLPSWGVTSPFNAVDIFVLAEPAVLAGLTAACVGIAALIRSGMTRAAAAAWVTSAALVALTATAATFVSPTPGLRQRAAAEFVRSLDPGADRPVSVWVAEPLFSAAGLRNAFDFWGLDLTAVSTAAVAAETVGSLPASCLTDDGDQGRDVLLAAEPLTTEPVHSSGTGQDALHIYLVRAECAARLTPTGT